MEKQIVLHVITIRSIFKIGMYTLQAVSFLSKKNN